MELQLIVNSLNINGIGSGLTHMLGNGLLADSWRDCSERCTGKYAGGWGRMTDEAWAIKYCLLVGVTGQGGIAHVTPAEGLCTQRIMESSIAGNRPAGKPGYRPAA